MLLKSFSIFFPFWLIHLPIGMCKKYLPSKSKKNGLFSEKEWVWWPNTRSRELGGFRAGWMDTLGLCDPLTSCVRLGNEPKAKISCENGNFNDTATELYVPSVDFKQVRREDCQSYAIVFFPPSLVVLILSLDNNFNKMLPTTDQTLYSITTK